MKLNDVGPSLRPIRKKSPYALKEVAAKSGVTISMLGHLERGDRTGSWEVLSAVAEALDHELSVVIAPKDRVTEEVEVTRREAALLANYAPLSQSHQEIVDLLVEVLPNLSEGEEALISGQLKMLSQRLRRAAANQ